MAKFTYTRECREWGPCDGHHYTDEDTGEYRPFCDCGQIDPAWHDPELVHVCACDPSDPDDQPPF